MSYQKITKVTKVAKSMASGIFIHTVKNTTEKQTATRENFLDEIDAKLQA
jgi:hypothetical protein